LPTNPGQIMSQVSSTAVDYCYNLLTTSKTYFLRGGVNADTMRKHAYYINSTDDWYGMCTL